MQKGYRADHRGRLFNLTWPFTRYIITHLTTTVLGILFFVLNRTTVVGRQYVPRRRNTLLLSNHQSMLDSFLVGFPAFYGPSLVKPYLIPWNPAAEENFYRNRFLGWWSDQWKCIPVKPGRRDLRALYRMIHALRGGTMILFPEGTRTRDTEIRGGRPGAGLVVLANHPAVVPVTVDGMHEILPVGSLVPRFFKRVYVVYGKPIDYSDFIGQERSKETAQRIVDRVVAVMREQLGWVRRVRTGEATMAELREWLDLPREKGSPA